MARQRSAKSPTRVRIPPSPPPRFPVRAVRQRQSGGLGADHHPGRDCSERSVQIQIAVTGDGALSDCLIEVVGDCSADGCVADLRVLDELGSDRREVRSADGSNDGQRHRQVHDGQHRDPYRCFHRAVANLDTCASYAGKSLTLDNSIGGLDGLGTVSGTLSMIEALRRHHTSDRRGDGTRRPTRRGDFVAPRGQRCRDRGRRTPFSPA